MEVSELTYDFNTSELYCCQFASASVRHSNRGYASPQAISQWTPCRAADDHNEAMHAWCSSFVFLICIGPCVTVPYEDYTLTKRVSIVVISV